MHTEHHITRRHRPISRCDAPSRSCLLPLLPQLLPPRRRLRRAHYFRVTADRTRRTPPPHTPAAAPAHAVDRAHPRTRFAPRTATSLPATLAAHRQRTPDEPIISPRSLVDNSCSVMAARVVCRLRCMPPLRRWASGSSWASLPAAACPEYMPCAAARRARPS